MEVNFQICPDDAVNCVRKEEKMKEIICPYCCKRFLPSEVDFRLERPVDEDTPQREQSDEPAEGFVNRKSSGPRNRKKTGYVQDEKLYQYYKNYLMYSDEEAAGNANQLPFVQVDLMSPDIRYDVEKYNRFGYVVEIQYKGQTLNQRLCPHCHNTVVPNAGKYDMLMISMIGDTNSGKSVYLTVLEEVLKKDPHFQGNLSFMGTDEEKALYMSSLKKLFKEKKTLSATQRTKIPPMPFLYTYEMPGASERIYKLIVFCDIAGEDCRQDRTMKQNGFHLAASDGFLFLIDVTQFPGVAYSIEEGGDADVMHQTDIFEAINRFLIANSLDNKTNIPAAVVLSKCDVLQQVGRVSGMPEYCEVLNDARGNDIQGNELHPGYINQEELNRLNQVIPAMSSDLGESDLSRNVRDNFSTYGYFVSSALGKSPKAVQVEENGVVSIENQVKGQIQPYRVAEPFYWLLAKANCIPYHYREVLENNKGKREVIELYYFENEKASLASRVDGARRSRGINLNGFLNKWKIVEQTAI